METNVTALDIINILDKSSPDECIRDLILEPSLVALSVDPVTDELFLFHHLARIGKILKKKTAKKNKKVMALHGFGTQA